MNISKLLKNVTCGLLAFSFSVMAYAGGEVEILSLDLDRAISLALDASEALHIRENDVAKRNSQSAEARSVLYPTLDGTASWQKHYLYPNLPFTAMTRDYNLSASVTATQIITTFGRVSAAIGAADKARDVTLFVRDGVKNDVVYATKVMYFNAYLAKKTLDIVQESYERASKNHDILKKRSENGRVSKHDNIKIMADLAARVPSVNSASAEFAMALETLKRHLGLDETCEITFAEGYRYDGEIDKEILYRSLDTSYPALKALYETISLYEEAIKGKKAEYRPSVSAFINGRYSGSSDTYYGANDLDTYGDLGVSVTIPLFSGGKRKQQLAQARIDKDNAILSAQKMHRDLTLELDKTLIEYRELLKTLPANDQAVYFSEETFTLSQDLFASGQLSVTDLNDAELMLTNQKLRKEAALFKVSALRAKIEMFTGVADDYSR